MAEGFQTFAEDPLGMAEAEFSSSMANQELSRSRLATLLRRDRDIVATALERYCEATGISLPIPAGDFAAVIVALVGGWRHQKRVDSTIGGPEMVTAALTYLWSGLTSPH
jgi:hypothetical protein